MRSSVVSMTEVSRHVSILLNKPSPFHAAPQSNSTSIPACLLLARSRSHQRPALKFTCSLSAQDFGLDTGTHFSLGIEARRKAFTEKHRRRECKDLHIS